jgi:hypothetical protein
MSTLSPPNDQPPNRDEPPEQAKRFNEGELEQDVDRAFETIFRDVEAIKSARAVGYDPSDEAIFQGIEKALGDQPAEAEEGELPLDFGDQARLLFEEILLEYIPPIKACINKIFQGDNSRSVIESFRGVLHPLIRACKTLQLDHLLILFKKFEVHLRRIERRKGLLTFKYIRPFSETYEKLILSLSPQLQNKYFTDIRFQSGQSPLLDELLNIRFVGPKRVQRIYAAGFTDIDALEKATPEQIHQVTGVGLKLAAKIKKAGRKHRKRMLHERVGRVAQFSLQIKREVEEALRRGEQQVIEETQESLEALHRWLLHRLPQVREATGVQPAKKPRPKPGATPTKPE